MSNTYRSILEKIAGAVVILALTPSQQTKAFKIARMVAKRS